jgi:hypothetical protein
VTDGVDAAAHTPESLIDDPSVYLTASHTESQKLLAGNHAVLALGKVPDRSLDVAVFSRRDSHTGMLRACR